MPKSPCTCSEDFDCDYCLRQFEQEQDDFFCTDADDDVYDPVEFEDVDIDVCLGCGRYYAMSPELEEAWRNSFNYRPNTIMDQLCLRCMRGEAPPHEY